jgi:hypothetical protein
MLGTKGVILYGGHPAERVIRNKPHCNTCKSHMAQFSKVPIDSPTPTPSPLGCQTRRHPRPVPPTQHLQVRQVRLNVCGLPLRASGEQRCEARPGLFGELSGREPSHHCAGGRRRRARVRYAWHRQRLCPCRYWPRPSCKEGRRKEARLLLLHSTNTWWEERAGSVASMTGVSSPTAAHLRI